MCLKKPSHTKTSYSLLYQFNKKRIYFMKAFQWSKSLHVCVQNWKLPQRIWIKYNFKEQLRDCTAHLSWRRKYYRPFHNKNEQIFQYFPYLHSGKREVTWFLIFLRSDLRYNFLHIFICSEIHLKLQFVYNENLNHYIVENKGT